MSTHLSLIISLVLVKKSAEFETLSFKIRFYKKKFK